MALGYTTYKTPNAINLIGSDLTGKEGCGVTLPLGEQGKVVLATASTDIPYGVVVVGGESVDGGYPGPIGGSAIEFVDMIGCTVQVTISGNAGVNAGDFLLIDTAVGDGTFVSSLNVAVAAGDWVWGLALTNCAAGEQCLMRFQPVNVQYIAP
mgnify:FL=1